MLQPDSDPHDASPAVDQPHPGRHGPARSSLDLGENGPPAGSDRRKEALRFLYDRIDYERFVSLPFRDLKLERMRELLARLGNPQQGIPIVHVAGTKGKGSTSVMIGAALTAAGYRTGVFTSPHLDRIEERTAIDGRPCSEEEFVELVDRLVPVVEGMDREASSNSGADGGPTYFEITTAMALCHFARCRVQAAVLEVGLGGRLDSTNVCLPQVSVITSISLDHTKQLGNTLESIAREKAGIIKPGVPLVSGVTNAGPREVIREVCRQQGARLTELETDFHFQYRPPRGLESAPAMGMLDFQYLVAGREHSYDRVALQLLGRHQAANAAVALAALAELQGRGFQISPSAIREGLAGVSWPARVELISRRPAIVVDAAHNRASVEALVQVLTESFSVGRRLLVFATTQEKDIRGMLATLLPQFDAVIFTRYSNNPRAVPPQELAAVAEELTGRSYPVVANAVEAWQEMVKAATPDDLVCVTGSFFIAAEIRQQLHPLSSALLARS
jgi:dihydrofolate synthase/folylpolyglutamate synthase